MRQDWYADLINCEHGLDHDGEREYVNTSHYLELELEASCCSRLKPLVWAIFPELGFQGGLQFRAEAQGSGATTNIRILEWRGSKTELGNRGNLPGCKRVSRYQKTWNYYRRTNWTSVAYY